MGDEDRTERPNPQEPTPQEPEPDGPGATGSARDDTGPETPPGEATSTAAGDDLTRPPDDDATSVWPEQPPADATEQAIDQPPADAAQQMPADATTQFPAGAAADQLPSDATTQLPAGATAHVPAADHTQVMPVPTASPVWEGRAHVRPQHPGLRESAPFEAAEPPQKSRTWWTPVLLGAVALGLVGLVVLAAWLLGRDTAPDPQITDTPGPIVATSALPAAPTTQAAPSPTLSAAPELVEIPRVVGDSQATATAKLDAAGLSYRLDFRQSSAPRDTVIAATPEAGTQVPRLTTVVLVISLGPADPTPTPRPTPTASATPNP